MSVIVTCGPSSEPIDQVRFLSNFSTGELGALLVAELHAQGFKVICLRSRLASYPIDPTAATIIPFTTNADLAVALEKISKEEKVSALFHAAALCDYRVEKVTDREGREFLFGKIPTNVGTLTMTLQPTLKLISKLRTLFPSSLLIGWKYEVDGTGEEASAKAHYQIKKYQLDASIANGPALEDSFNFIPASGASQRLDSKVAVACFLVEWLKSKRGV